MTEHDDLTARLEALGRTEPPAPTDAFLDTLRPRPARPRHVFRVPVLLPTAAVAALVLGFVLVTFSGGDDPATRTVVLQQAVDASVEVDGHPVDVTPGEALPEGAVVTTGLDGSASVDGVRLGPGEQAVVRRGRLVRRERLLAVPETLHLDVSRVRPRIVGLEWTPYSGEDFGAYVVLRADGRIVARRFDPNVTRAFDRLAIARSARYVVVVVDKDRQPVARSQIPQI